MTTTKNIVIVGAGPGVGNHVAMEFASQGFHAILISRNEKKLADYRKELSALGYCVDTLVADTNIPRSLTEAFDQIKSQWGTPDVLVFNAADTQPDQDLPSSSELMERYQTEVASAMHCIELVRGKDFSDKKGCVLLTGGGLAMYPISEFIPLSVNKAALRTLAYCLHEKPKNENIFVGTVTICSTVGADQFFSPQNIAKAYWDLYEKRSNCEVVYAYPEIKDSEEALPLSANHYWLKVGELKNSHDGE